MVDGRRIKLKSQELLENLKQIMKCSRVKPEQIKYTKVKSKDERDISWFHPPMIDGGTNDFGENMMGGTNGIFSNSGGSGRVVRGNFKLIYLQNTKSSLMESHNHQKKNEGSHNFQFFKVPKIFHFEVQFFKHLSCTHRQPFCNFATAPKAKVFHEKNPRGRFGASVIIRSC